ncbi:MAG: hypothetical protein ACP5M9_02250 [Candidatus Micrarchaeia archaeon]
MMLKENLKLPVVIEVEPETLSPTAAKRINFYKRLGAKQTHLVIFNQPIPLQKGQSP